LLQTIGADTVGTPGLGVRQPQGSNPRKGLKAGMIESRNDYRRDDRSGRPPPAWGIIIYREEF
jgi:hypothetical protein